MPKLLVEFLREQQEPFVLDVYLLERGYYTHISQNSRRFFNQSACRGHKKRRQASINCTQIVGTVFTRLVLRKTRKIKNTCTETNDPKRREEEDGNEDEFSSASATTLFNSCSESDVEDAEFITKHSSFSHELSPVSVLDETEFECSPPPHQSTSPKSAEKQRNFKKWMYKCKPKKPRHKFEEWHDQYNINKRVLQQKKKLMAECVREVIENERKRDDESGRRLKKMLGVEELWKLVYENVWLRSQHSTDQTNIFRMLNSDFMASLAEWSSASDQQRNEIVVEIGDAILEDIVNEIVAFCTIK